MELLVELLLELILGNGCDKALSLKDFLGPTIIWEELDRDFECVGVSGSWKIEGLEPLRWWRGVVLVSSDGDWGEERRGREEKEKSEKESK